MERRDFLKSVLGATALGVTPGLTLVNCNKSKPVSNKTIDVDGIEYQLQDGVLSQASAGDSQIKLGIMADLHAHQDNTQFFVDQLSKEGVNVYFLAGDLSHSFGDYEGAKDDFNEILSVVEPVAKTGKLVLVIPGNHEQRKTYTKALERLEANYDNVVNMEKTPVADLDDLTIVALGGNANARFCVPEGFLRDRGDFERLQELVQKNQGSKPLLVGTHAPRQYKSRNGLDVIDRGANVGLFPYFATHKVSGHIHEAYGIVTPDEKKVKPGDLVDIIEFNPGAVYDHVGRDLRPAAGILEFVGNQARAYILNR